jgi:hypothetical protein
MATYLEIIELLEDREIANRVQIAALVAADTIRAESSGTANHDNRLKWARDVIDNPAKDNKRMVKAVIIQNRALTVAQIKGASDANLQTAVDAVVNLFAV